MPDPLAIRMSNVSKVYQLCGSRRDQFIHVLGLERFGFKLHSPAKAFPALDNVSLEVKRGQRIGIVGSNGAGKTTLLKLITGNFAPSSGTVEVHGTVQALMNVGLGFHAEHSGRENVISSLQYSGLRPEEYEAALEEIIEFCELGDFFDQPFKTYSMGMQARLMFAASTAIKPDLLIVDEVLGAGDAYFVAKSKKRVDQLIGNGCTMLLVSHSMQQVLELCSEAIWLDSGRVRMEGEAFDVVKAYEEFLHSRTDGDVPQLQADGTEVRSQAASDGGTDGTTVPVANGGGASNPVVSGEKWGRNRMPHFALQEPAFLPHDHPVVLPKTSTPVEFNFLAKGGLSRWGQQKDIEFVGFTIVSEHGETNQLLSLKPAKFVVSLAPKRTGNFVLRYGVAIYDHLGRCIHRLMSPEDSFYCSKGNLHTFEVIFNPLQLGPGEYTISLSAHKYASLEILNSTPRYDLLNRSFVFNIDVQESLKSITTEFFHSAEWNFQNGSPEQLAADAVKPD